MTDQETPLPENETSVWDYFVTKLQFWTKDNKDDQEDLPEPQPQRSYSLPWLTIAAIIFALLAQLSLEPSNWRTALPGIILYLFAGISLIAAIFRKELALPEYKPDHDTKINVFFRIEFLLIGLMLAVFAFLLFGGGEFGLINTSLWVLSLGFLFYAFWWGKNPIRLNFKTIWGKIVNGEYQIKITQWGVILLAVIAVILFFNFDQLETVPPEMVSDQAEKLMDINDILNGYTPIYFPRNTGREVIHFYLTAAYMKLFNLDVSYMNLKVVAVFANLLTVFFIYLLGKEIGNKWVGLAAALLSGIAYWPLVFTRVALRIPYYPLFVAPVMYFLIRGLRRQNVGDILWTGLFLGLGLHGYTPFRIVPIFVLLVFAIYAFHSPGKKKKLLALYALSLIVLVSLVVFIPLLRYWLANPELFSYRAFSRLTSMEVDFQNSPVIIFLQNFWKASIMFFWDNGSIWVHSIPGRPALEVVSAALYFIGIIGLLFRYIRRRHWVDLVLLVSIPMLLMPSILSIAFPAENPSLNRTAGATVPVFVVVGLAFETIIRTLKQKLPGRIGKTVVILIVVLLVVWSGLNNYNLVFDRYQSIYRASSWNTSEMGRVAQFFINTIGSSETVYAVGYPHWADSRLIAINAGYPGGDFAIFSEQIPNTARDPRAKVFLLNLNDAEGMQVLEETFENGVTWQYDSSVENKDFLIFFVPPSQGATN
jgi:hypothetical protein